MARIHLKLSQKGEIVEQLDKGVGVTVLAKNYGVAKSTICSIRNRRVNIMKKISNTYVGPGKIKTLRSSECPRIENALYRWFLKQREKHIPVTGFMIKEKAKKLHEEYKETPCFNASSGWLQRYKKRFGIRYLKISGEKLSSAIETVNPFKKTLLEKLDELQLLKEQIYNADESSLYWKLLPDKTYVGSEEKTAPGRKTEKQRVTFLACTNAAGNHKLKPLVIGKAKNPRSFRNFNCPVHYRNSKTAWMTRFIFKEWFFKMFIPEVQEFLNDKKLPVKAILLLDNAPSHPPADELKSADGSIFVMYMPPNITPLIQPMDQNVIRLTKLFYRKSLLSRIINDNVDCIGTALKSLSLKDAIVNLILAWNSLKPDVIEKCWNKILSPLEETPSDSDDEYDIPLSELKLRWRNKEMDHVTKEIKNLLLHVNPRVEIETADIDEWNRDYVQDVEEAEIFIESDEVSDDVPDENSENNIQAITTSNALKSLNEVIQWTDENQNRIDYSTIIVLHNLRHAMVQMNVEKTQKQTKITSFFEKIF